MENNFIEQEEKMLYLSPLVAIESFNCADIITASEFETDNGLGDNDVDWWQ